MVKNFQIWTQIWIEIEYEFKWNGSICAADFYRTDTFLLSFTSAIIHNRRYEQQP